MKFAILPSAWEVVIDRLEAEGHTRVELADNPELVIYNGSADNFPELPESVQWIQFTLAGIDAFFNQGIIAPGRRYSNASGTYARPVAESAVALLLAALHLYPKIARSKSWDTTGQIDRDTRWLHDSHVAIIGAGGIGRDAILMLKGFGCRVTAVNNSGNPVPGADQTVDASQTERILSEADHVILAAPLTDDTVGMINRERLALMKSDAILVNVGRGPLVVTDDLVDALKEGVIAGAALDVTDPEPLPDDHPLWEMDNVLISPHVANTAANSPRLIAETIVDNARLYLAGETMTTEVEPDKGY